MTKAPRSPRLALALVAVCAFTGCAPHAHRALDLDAGSRHERYLAALGPREERAASLDAEIALWLRGASVGTLPGVLGDLRIGAPDTFRLRVRSPLGTAFEVGGRADRLVALLPSRRWFLEASDAGESLGVPNPGEFVVRTCAAAWRPPEEAWAGASWQGDLRIVRWVEHGDSLRLSVNSAGLPVEVERARTGRGALRIGYAEWSRDRVAWPARFEIEAGESSARLTCRVERTHIPAAHDPEHFRVAPPAHAERLAWPDVMNAFAHETSP
ncbi:MAG: hypothetical protein HYR73_07580 [Candidatus Eisenbacteria bacterium]|nr:hypothetical protein [Candidatus Eisenbacteria bacterium]